MSCGVGRRHSSDPKVAVATALIGPLAWEPSYAERSAQEMAKGQKKKKRIYLEMNKNNTTYQNLQYTMKAVIKEKCIVVNGYIKKSEEFLEFRFDL